MAYEIAGSSVKMTAIAGVDLSTYQYTFVKLNSSGQAIPVAAATDVAIGVLQNAPKVNMEAEITVIGGSKIVSSAALAVGTVLGTSAAGLGVALTPGTDITKYVFGQIIYASGAANEIATAILDCAAPGRAS